MMCLPGPSIIFTLDGVLPQRDHNQSVYCKWCWTGCWFFSPTLSGQTSPALLELLSLHSQERSAFSNDFWKKII